MAQETMSTNEALGRLTHLWGMFKKANPDMAAALKLAMDMMLALPAADPAEMVAYRQGGAVLVRMPVDTLVYACEHSQAFPCKVSDKEAFAAYIAEQLMEHGWEEDGSTAFQRLLDSLFEEAAADGVIAPDDTAVTVEEEKRLQLELEAAGEHESAGLCDHTTLSCTCDMDEEEPEL